MNKIKTVLIIDSNDIDNLVNSKILENYGVNHVISFKSAKKALLHLKETEFKYELILSDIYMPGMDGFEFIDEFYKLNLQTRHGKIHLLSASINPKDIEKSSEKNVKFIDKPLSIDKLKSI